MKYLEREVLSDLLRQSIVFALVLVILLDFKIEQKNENKAKLTEYQICEFLEYLQIAQDG